MQLVIPVDKNWVNKKNVIYIITLLFITFCNLWIYKAVPMPLYYFYLIGLLFIPFFLFIKKKISLSKAQILSIICSVYILSVFVYGENDWVYVIHDATAISYFVIATLFLKCLKPKQVINITNYLITFNLLIISLETYWRLSHPLYRNLENPSETLLNSFYIYKCNSFMISDSNSIGLMTMLLCILGYYMYKKVKPSNFYKYSSIAFGILTFSSLSRSAIIALICAFLINFIISKKIQILNLLTKWKISLKYLLITLLLISILPFLLIYLYNKLILDTSFNTKIDLFINTLKYIKDSSIVTALFGSGTSLDYANAQLGRFPHNIVTTYILWHGIIGLGLIYYMWWQIFIETNRQSGILLIAWFFAGISFVQVGLHLFYCVLAIMYYFENKKAQNNEKNNFNGRYNI